MLYTDCPVHGLQVAVGLIGGTGTIKMMASLTTCPVLRCGRTVPIVDGTYELANNVLKGFRTATREDLEALQNITSAISNGEISKEQADAQVAHLGRGIRQVWEWANANPALFSVLGIVVAIMLTWWSVRVDDLMKARPKRKNRLNLE